MLQYELCQPTVSRTDFSGVLGLVESNSQKWAELTTKAYSRQIGQVFTPIAMSQQLSSLLPDSELKSREPAIADPGAGTGILSTCLAARLYEFNPTPLSIFGFETDRRVAEDFTKAWALFQEQADHPIDHYLFGSFAEHAETLLTTGEWPDLPKPDYITTNPPFIKLAKSSELSQTLTKHGIAVTNIYAAFVALATCWLKDDGCLLAILPRSFASGDYFKVFRKWLGERMSVEHIMLFKSRSCFRNVLQENICIYMKKKTDQTRRVRITVSENPTSTPDYDLILPASEIITDAGWLLPRSVQDIVLLNQNRQRPETLSTLGLNFSTGKIELHRVNGDIETPVIYARDFDAVGTMTWGETKKPRIVSADKKQILDLPEKGGYVGLKRISSNDGENAQRLYPVWLSRDTTGYDQISIDNHVQFIHRNGEPLTQREGEQLVNFLLSDESQAVMRSCCGTTQINRADIEKLKFPLIV
ncbi:N-6 DNA methylase [Vibrio coralliilyticus]|uniref:site-specific DNA-methyltransferase (adenine-specific) n=1 Tax=Vibrio coralliilyticus TaxID=190893 RepID=A0AAN0SJW6_9VIBR|nr:MULTISPECIES: N-6 DNA methylase [Vibrio]AIW22382.1 hypothetical protein IX92_25260 [Vibrio coralliilyticus]MCZ2799036.1 N-6 DNA methylase [Vibrio alginolyticus]NOH36936.1 N-6 DNA methylase [Vibrio coralliilyticus]